MLPTHASFVPSFLCPLFFFATPPYSFLPQGEYVNYSIATGINSYWQVNDYLMPYATLRGTKRNHPSIAYLHRVHTSHVYSITYIYVYTKRNISVYSYITTRCGLRLAGNDTAQEHHMTRDSQTKHWLFFLTHLADRGWNLFLLFARIKIWYAYTMCPALGHSMTITMKSCTNILWHNFPQSALAWIIFDARIQHVTR